MNYGNYPGDGTHLSLNRSEHDELLHAFPETSRILRRVFGAQEMIKDIERYCLWISDADVPFANSIPPVKTRIDKVRDTRLSSKDAGYRNIADRPHQYRDTLTHEDDVILVPTVSSERREFFPIRYEMDEVVTTNQVFALYDAPLWCLSLLASRLHILWIEAVCGKLETRLRYSNTLGWHTFPVPHLTRGSKAALTRCAEDILVTRARLGGTLAELYDPDKMPDELREAHRVNDETLEALYTRSTFRSDADRLNHLFKRYVRMSAREKGEAVDPDPELDFGEARA